MQSNRKGFMYINAGRKIKIFTMMSESVQFLVVCVIFLFNINVNF